MEPAVLEVDFDINGDGSREISVRVDTASGKARLLHRAPWVLGLELLIAADSECIVRVL
jgi:hypothetical protein